MVRVYDRHNLDRKGFYLQLPCGSIIGRKYHKLATNDYIKHWSARNSKTNVTVSAISVFLIKYNGTVAFAKYFTTANIKAKKAFSKYIIYEFSEIKS